MALRNFVRTHMKPHLTHYHLYKKKTRLIKIRQESESDVLYKTRYALAGGGALVGSVLRHFPEVSAIRQV